MIIGTEGDILLKVLVAGMLGYIVGIEREFSGHEAGERTFSLVAMASALFTALGIEVFGQTSTEAPARIAQNILTGVGFLGGGMILKEGLGVRGLTTAAGIWAIAAVGMSVGTGRYLVAVVASGLILLLFLASRLHTVHRHRHDTPQA